MSVQFAGIPLLSATPEMANIIANTLSLSDVLEFCDYNPVVSAGRLPTPAPGVVPRRQVRVNSLYWPRGAQNYAIGHFLVDDDMLVAISQKVYVGGSYGTQAYSPQPLIITETDAMGVDSGVNTITTSMFLISAHPLFQVGSGNPRSTGTSGGNVPTTGVGNPDATQANPDSTGRSQNPDTTQNQFDGLWLLTLCDDRYWWSNRDTGKVTITAGTTQWTDIFNSLGASLNVTIATDPVNAAYPLPDPGIGVNYEKSAPYLDGIAFLTGMRIIRHLDGSVYARNATNTATDQQNNVQLPSAKQSLAKRGGGKFRFDVNINPNELPGLLPLKVQLLFPQTSNPVPFPQTAALSALSIAALPSTVVTNNENQTFHYPYVYDGTNLTNVQQLTNQFATDWYQFQIGKLDIAYHGIIPWVPEAFDDIEWHHDADGVWTRINRCAINECTDSTTAFENAKNEPSTSPAQVVTDEGIWLVGTNQFLDAQCGDSAQLPWTLDYGDTGTNTQGEAHGNTIFQSQFHMVQGTGTGVRAVKHVSINNNDAANPHTITVMKNDSAAGTSTPLVQVQLPSGSSLHFDYKAGGANNTGGEWYVVPDSATPTNQGPPGTSGTTVNVSMTPNWTVTGNPAKPTATINLASPLSAKGDIYIRGADGNDKPFPTGPDTFVLTSDASQLNGIAWESVSTVGTQGGTVTSVGASRGARTSSVTQAPITVNGQIWGDSPYFLYAGGGQLGIFDANRGTLFHIGIDGSNVLVPGAGNVPPNGWYTDYHITTQSGTSSFVTQDNSLKFSGGGFSWANLAGGQPGISNFNVLGGDSFRIVSDGTFYHVQNLQACHAAVFNLQTSASLTHNSPTSLQWSIDLGGVFGTNSTKMMTPFIMAPTPSTRLVAPITGFYRIFTQIQIVNSVANSVIKVDVVNNSGLGTLTSVKRNICPSVTETVAAEGQCFMQIGDNASIQVTATPTDHNDNTVVTSTNGTECVCYFQWLGT